MDKQGFIRTPLQTFVTAKDRLQIFNREHLPKGKEFENFMNAWSFCTSTEMIKKLSSFEYRFCCFSRAEASEEWIAGAMSLFSSAGADLIYIYVRPKERGKGYGKKLLDSIAKQIILDQSCLDKRLVLEVHISNRKAHKLYESFNMQIVGKRINYYGRDEHALVFAKDLST